MNYNSSQTICWDCANATGGCRWSSELKPIKGWKAIHVAEDGRYGYGDSYIVQECPEFERDSYGGGQARLDKESIYKMIG